MPDHVHEWQLHNTAYAGIPTAWATCECGADIDHDVIQRRLNATERLSAEVAIGVAHFVIGTIEQTTNGKVVRPTDLEAYASALEGE